MRKELSKMTKEEIETERQALTADYRSKIEKLIFTKKNKMNNLPTSMKLSMMQGILSSVLENVEKEIDGYEKQQAKKAAKEHEDYLDYRRCVHGWDC